jgi:hypothetical protein
MLDTGLVYLPNIHVLRINTLEHKFFGILSKFEVPNYSETTLSKLKKLIEYA